MSRDPIGYDGGIDVYAYCHNSSEDGSDPLGLFLGAPTVTGPPEIAIGNATITETTVLEAGGGTVIAGGGPEEPVGDVGGAVVIIVGSTTIGTVTLLGTLGMHRYSGAEHTKGARPSTGDKHTKKDGGAPDRGDQRPYPSPKKRRW